MELVRAAYYGYYGTVLTELAPIVDGFAYALPGPGLGTELRPDFLAAPDVTRRRSER